MATLTTGYKVVAETSTQSFNGVLGKLQILAKYTSQSITNNTTVTNYVARFVVSNGGYIYDGGGVSWNLKDNQNNTTSKSGQNVQWYNGNHDFATLTPTIKHNTDGTKSINISSSITFGNWGKTFSTNATVELPSIPRGSIITSITSATESTASPLSLEDTLSIALTKYVESYTDNLSIVVNEEEIKQINNIYDGYEITFSEEELNVIFSLMENSKDGEAIFSFITSTYNGEDLIQINEYNQTLKIYDANPEFNDYTIQYSDPSGCASYSNQGYFFKDHSTLHIYITSYAKAIAQKGASMVKYVFASGNRQIEVDYSETDLVVADFLNVTDRTFTVTAIDSRGNSTKAIVEIDKWADYWSPVITAAEIDRKDNGVDTRVNLLVEGKYFYYLGEGIYNPTKLKAYYREYGSSSDFIEIGQLTYDYEEEISKGFGTIYINYRGEINGDKGASGFTLGKAFEIKLVLENYMDGDTEEIVLDSGTPAIAIHRRGISFGQQYDEELGGTVQINGRAFYNGEELGTGGGDTVPVGAIFDYEGTEVPDGYVEVGNQNYSTEEQFSGRYWIGGEPIYTKTYHIDGLPSAAGSKTIASGLTPTQIRVIEFHGVGRQTTDGWCWPISVARPDANAASIGIALNSSGQLVVYVGQDRHLVEIYVTLEYIKL